MSSPLDPVPGEIPPDGILSCNNPTCSAQLVIPGKIMASGQMYIFRYMYEKAWGVRKTPEFPVPMPYCGRCKDDT